MWTRAHSYRAVAARRPLCGDVGDYRPPDPDRGAGRGMHRSDPAAGDSDALDALPGVQPRTGRLGATGQGGRQSTRTTRGHRKPNC